MKHYQRKGKQDTNEDLGRNTRKNTVQTKTKELLLVLRSLGFWIPLEKDPEREQPQTPWTMTDDQEGEGLPERRDRTKKRIGNLERKEKEINK